VRLLQNYKYENIKQLRRNVTAAEKPRNAYTKWSICYISISTTFRDEGLPKMTFKVTQRQTKIT